MARCSKCNVTLSWINQTGKGNWCDECRKARPVKHGTPVNLNGNNQQPHAHIPRRDYEEVEKQEHSVLNKVQPLVVEYNGDVEYCFGNVSVVIGKSNKHGLTVRGG